MKHMHKILLISSLFASFTAWAESAEPVALCFDERMISMRSLQNLDMKAALEAIYEMAEASGNLDELPAAFMRCLEVVRSGDDRVRYCDFMTAIRLVIDKVLLTRGIMHRGLCLNSLSLEDEFDDFVMFVNESLYEIWERLALIELCTGLRKFEQ